MPFCPLQPRIFNLHPLAHAHDISWCVVYLYMSNPKPTLPIRNWLIIRFILVRDSRDHLRFGLSLPLFSWLLGGGRLSLSVYKYLCTSRFPNSITIDGSLVVSVPRHLCPYLVGSLARSALSVVDFGQLHPDPYNACLGDLWLRRLGASRTSSMITIQ